MIGWQQKSPVALLIFNRPDTTEAVFQTVRDARPPKLLVVADGPRTDRPDEAEKCAGARAIVDRVDWNCEVLTNYSDVNLGCKRRVASGLDWVFSEVEEAIILEDDTVPHPTFFRYCDELLERYRDDERVMAITGDNFHAGWRRTEDSYYFSRYAHMWGWASWRRAWKYYDVEMEHWPRVRDGGWLGNILQDPSAVRYWLRILQATYEGRIDTWDYQWMLSCWLQSGLCTVPNVNLVSNIGFGTDSTHTFVAADPLANLPSAELDFPLRHPPFIIRDTVADDFVQRTRFEGPKFGARVRNKIRARMKRLRAGS